MPDSVDDLKFDELMADDPEPFVPTKPNLTNEPSLAANATDDEGMASLSDLNAETHRDTPVAFVTGRAGCGKTHEMKRRVEEDRRYGVLVASTGIAAINLNAQTINSLLKFFDTASLKDNYVNGRLQATLRKIALTGVKNIILDECSMTPKEQFDIFYMALNDVNQLASVKCPLGMIVVGDWCLGVGTGVMMSNGSIKRVEDIVVGDQVMGPDSRPRNVLRTTRGIDNLFLVTQTNGDDYIVNSRHRLALMRSPDGHRLEKYTYGAWQRYPNVPDKTTLTAPELIGKSRKFRECFIGYKAGLISLPARVVTIDPYFLGLWLGDGDYDNTRITTADQEVLEYCGAYARQLGLNANVKGWGDKTKAVRISLTHSKADVHVPNPLRIALRNYGIWKNKHVPEDYLLNSEQVRLEVLAGLLDSDGCWSGNRFVFHATLECLVRNVKQLADSLGFRTAFYPSTAPWYRNGDHGGAWEVTICGDTWRIPTRIKRKQSVPRDLVKSRLTSVLDIIPYGVGDYAGFEIDGDHFFCLADGTVTHNCQLPPVKAEWGFKADCWPKFAANTTRLTKNWRQSDPRFLDAINFLRAGEGANAAAILREIVPFHSGLDERFDGTTIQGKNDEVDRYNRARLMQLTGKTINLRSRQWGAPDQGAWKNIPPEFFLKEGAYVMILTNSGADLQFANGDTGHVKEFDGKAFHIELVRNGEIVRIYPIHRTKIAREAPSEYPNGEDWEFFDSSVGDRPPYGRVSFDESLNLWHVGGIQYYPLRPAYATTCHKSQGLSLDRVQIDLRGHFMSAPAMMYVSVSRCKSPEGLRLVGTPELVTRKCSTDPEVRPYI